MSSQNYRSCYSHLSVQKGRDDACCFFSGSSCVGAHTIDLSSAITGCIITNYNFINDSESSGCVRIFYPNVWTFVKQSVFSFDSKSNSMKWIFYANSGSGVAIEDSFVISTESFSDDARVVMNNVETVVSASTHRRFQNRPRIALCGLNSGSFSVSKDFIRLLPFIRTSLAMITLSAK